MKKTAAFEAAAFKISYRKLLTPSISYMDSYENFYHGFMVGILTGSNEYAVKSNREPGDGRSGLLMRTGDVFEKAFVIELKAVKQEGFRLKNQMQREGLQSLKQYTQKWR